MCARGCAYVFDLACSVSACARLPVQLTTDTQENPEHTTDHTTGRDPDGGSRGITTFTCRECGWKIVFRFDDKLEPRYFETKGWRKSSKMRSVAVGILAAQRMNKMMGAMSLGGAAGGVPSAFNKGLGKHEEAE
jgi:hypothetical protein